MADRLLIAAAFVCLGIGLYILARRLHLWAIGRQVQNVAQDLTPGLAAFEPGRPALLYFTAEHCVPCRTVIKPTLQRLATELAGRFQVLEIDAVSQTEAARHWKVLSVPTIFVLDPQGKPQHVHYGVVSSDVLRAQLSEWLQPV